MNFEATQLANQDTVAINKVERAIESPSDRLSITHSIVVTCVYKKILDDIFDFLDDGFENVFGLLEKWKLEI